MIFLPLSEDLIDNAIIRLRCEHKDGKPVAVPVCKGPPLKQGHHPFISSKPVGLLPAGKVKAQNIYSSTSVKIPFFQGVYAFCSLQYPVWGVVYLPHFE